MAGVPDRSEGMVNTSDRYMASGFSVFSPSRNAVVGDVGETRRSNRSNKESCSCLISVRTFWAWP